MEEVTKSDLCFRIIILATVWRIKGVKAEQVVEVSKGEKIKKLCMRMAQVKDNGSRD